MPASLSTRPFGAKKGEAGAPSLYALCETLSCTIRLAVVTVPRDINDDDGALTQMVGKKPDTQFKIEYIVMLSQLAMKSGGWLPMHVVDRGC